MTGAVFEFLISYYSVLYLKTININVASQYAQQFHLVVVGGKNTY